MSKNVGSEDSRVEVVETNIDTRLFDRKPSKYICKSSLGEDRF